MDTRLAQFVHGLYFDIQTIEGVRPLEIWNGIRELEDPYETTCLVKNLYKIVVPLVNEGSFGLPFEQHSRRAEETVKAVISWFSENPDARIFERFPYPPTGDGDQKELYRMVKARAALLLEHICLSGAGEPPQGPSTQALSQGVFPDGLFDFREMRIVDNELPYIIFTDKEFRVIHGLAIVYLWLIDLDAIFIATLEGNGVGGDIPEEYRQLARKIHRDNPLTLQGWKMEASELPRLIRDKLKEENYLDFFESIYGWFEQTKEKLRTQ
jgi:hypothetical protein